MYHVDIKNRKVYKIKGTAELKQCLFEEVKYIFNLYHNVAEQEVDM
ncbi:hypothetical protein V4_2531 [Lactococcus cremoris]|nr:hypothetical protein V4_2531 [Lactococcus cremoris]